MAQTKVSGSWSIRLYAMLVLAVVLGGWFLYDAAIKYPKGMEIYQSYQEQVEMGGEAAWVEYAEENNLPIEPPDEFTQGDITTQWVMFGVCGLLFIGVLVYLAMHHMRNAKSDDEGVRIGSQFIPYTAIEDIDKSQWEDKGIARIKYRKDNTEGSFTLDEWKYDGAKDVLADIESATGRSTATTV